MDLYLSTIQVVPMLFIALFLDRRHNTRTESDTDARTAATLRFFHLVVATLGLVAFSVSLYLVGSEAEPQGWMRPVVTSALAFAMAALSAQIFLTLTKSRQVSHSE